MLLNDTRGSLGMFSRAGRNSSEKYHIISRKEEILSGGRRKIKIKNIFTPDSNPKQYEALDDQIDIFKIDIADNQDNHNKNNFTNKSTEQINYKPIKTSKSQIIGRKQVKVKRSSMNIKKKKTSSPSCTKYNPKNEYIWKRVLTGPEWTKVTGRKDYIKPVTEGDYFMTQTDFKVTGKTFINFAKQTHRKGFSKIYNSSTCNKTVSSDKRLATEPHLISQEMDTSIINIHIDYPDNDISIHQIPNKTVHSSDNHDLGTAKTTKNKNSLLKSYPSLFSNTTTSKWRQNNAPDFKKVISREQLNKIYGDKRSVIPFSMPDDKSTREKTIMMVKYDKSLRRNYSRQPTEIKNEMKIDYDPNKCLEHVNNYKKPKAPNFDLMISRPCDETDPLPAYMKKIYSRQASGMISEKTLKMNNYSDGKFLETYTSFWPKKSFNKLINLNLLNSEKFLDNVGVQATPKSDNAMTEYVQKSMRFYNKNFDDLMKESMLNKFDNVTFKTIQKENRINPNDVEKFIMNFDKTSLNK